MQIQDDLKKRFQDTFGVPPSVITRAPGRVEFIGNHTDYNGGTVLGAAIDRSIWVAVSSGSEGKLRFGSGISSEIVSVDSSSPDKQSSERSWVNYPLGVWVEMEKFGLRRPEGLNFMDASTLPPGSGLSSSAAIELASVLAFTALTGEKPSKELAATVGRSAENNFVGVPCGILDQGSSAFGEKDRLVYIDCRGPSFSTVPMPADAHLWVFNTHTKHALVDGFYAARHDECMAAAKTLGVELLADANLEMLEAKKSEMGDIPYKRARHVLEEIARVAEVCEALQKEDLVTVGKALTASHRSSQHQFENSTPELDFLVDTLTRQKAVYGARLSGGGFGGAVMALTSGEYGEKDAGEIVAAYKQKYGEAPDVLHLKAGQGAEVVEKN